VNTPANNPGQSAETAAPGPSQPPVPNQTGQTEQPSRVRRFFWQGKLGPAFWTVSGLLSLTVNIILFIIILILVRQIFAIKQLVGDQLIGGLYQNFVKMDQARIKTMVVVEDTIQVNDTIPVVFTLPLKQQTEVVLASDAPIKKAIVYLNGAAVPTDIVLKKGTKLNIYLDLSVPVNQTIPVTLNVPVKLEVPVEIPLSSTELHEPFVGLQGVLAPYKALIDPLPNSWEEAFCDFMPDWMCK
jgi:hypothetical protein